MSSGFHIGTQLFHNIKEKVKEHWNRFKWMFDSDDSKETSIDEISFRRKRFFKL
jgi:hypothetical protein